MQIKTRTLRHALLPGLLLLAACQTTSDVSGPGTAEQAGIIDEGSEQPRNPGVKRERRVSAADYARTMRALDPQLAEAANLMVVTRGLQRSCKDDPVASRSGFDRFLSEADRLFAEIFARAFAMETQRLEAEGEPSGPALIGLVLTTTAAADTSDDIVGVSRQVERRLGRDQADMNDTERLAFGCALLSRSTERQVITRRISEPLAGYFARIKRTYPDIYDAVSAEDGAALFSQI